MNKPGVKEERFTPAQLGLIQTAALGIGLVLRGEVVGFILNDEQGVCIVPKPGVGPELFRVLAATDWDVQVRLAEEFST